MYKMEAVKKLYKKMLGDKKYSKTEIDQLCLNMKAVYQINNSKKTYKDKVNLIGRLVPDIKEILKDQEENKDLDLLGDLVRQWVVNTTKVCKENLAKMGVKSDKEVKEYMTKLLGPRYVPTKEPPVKRASVSKEPPVKRASSIYSIASINSLPGKSKSKSSSKKSTSSSKKTIVPVHRRSTLIDVTSPFEP
jgi:hypothetical protein